MVRLRILSMTLAMVLCGVAAAYVTADYSIKYETSERVTESGGISTIVLVKDGGVWKIRHHHTASRRRPAGGQ
jgi:hypothetical protein